MAAEDGGLRAEHRGPGVVVVVVVAEEVEKAVQRVEDEFFGRPPAPRRRLALRHRAPDGDVPEMDPSRARIG